MQLHTLLQWIAIAQVLVPCQCVMIVSEMPLLSKLLKEACVWLGPLSLRLGVEFMSKLAGSTGNLEVPCRIHNSNATMWQLYDFMPAFTESWGYFTHPHRSQ